MGNRAQEGLWAEGALPQADACPSPGQPWEGLLDPPEQSRTGQNRSA